MSRFLGLSMMLALVHLLLASTQANAKNASTSGYVASGLLTYAVNGKEGLKTNCVFKFTVWVSESKWVIRTENVKKGDIKYNEDAFDGNSVYSLSVYIPEKVSQGDNRSSGIIQNNIIPDEASFYAQPIWLALASSTYFKTIEGNRIKPIWHLSDLALTYTNYTVVGAWEMAQKPPTLPGKVVYYSDGIIRYVDKLGHRKISQHPSPYDKGFCEASFSALATTNVGGMEFPKSFEFIRFVPKFGGNDTNELVILCKYFGVIADVSLENDRASFAPEIEPPAYVEDRRLLVTAPFAKPIYYQVTNQSWLSTDNAVVKKLHEERLLDSKLIEKPRLNRYSRFYVLGLFLASVVIFATLIWWSRDKEKPTIK